MQRSVRENPVGHWARGADLTDRVVVADVASTGAYEGSSAWATAKFGVAVGVKAMGLTAALAVPGAPAASILVGVTIGAAAAISAKRLVNGPKNIAVDAAGSSTAGSPVQDGGTKRYCVRALRGLLRACPAVAGDWRRPVPTCRLRHPVA